MAPRLLTRREFLAAGVLAGLGCGGAARARGVLPPRRRVALAAEPSVRVGLAVGAPEARFVARGGRYVIREDAADLPIAVAGPDEAWGVVARAPGELRVVDPRGWLSQPHRRAVRVEPLDSAGALTLGERAYGGALEVLAAGTAVTLVNELPLEEYLRGVLGHEMPGAAEAPEALRAQAVAARTYAVKRLGSRAALGFDVFADVQDQVYGGLGGSTPAGDAALKATRGRVLLAAGNVVDAFYHSTCGGSTAAVEEAFPRSPVPYLVSVGDGDGAGGFYCSRSRYFRWRAAYAGTDVERLLGRNLGRFTALASSGVGMPTDISIVESSARGRVLALRFETTTGTYQVARDDVRRVFADESSPGLRSTLFLLRRERRGGFVESLTLTGGGWGHGVGMCQTGAIGRAGTGADHEQILTHYYRGARVERLYD